MKRSPWYKKKDNKKKKKDDNEKKKHAFMDYLLKEDKGEDIKGQRHKRQTSIIGNNP